MYKSSFVSSEGYSQRKLIANSYYDWLSEQNVDLHVTLNFNQDRTLSGARHQFGQWLARIDRLYLGRRWYRRGDRRTFAVGIIEHPLSNIHLHVLAKLPEPARELLFPVQEQSLRACWIAIEPAGSLYCTPIYALRGVASLGVQRSA